MENRDIEIEEKRKAIEASGKEPPKEVKRKASKSNGRSSKKKTRKKTTKKATERKSRLRPTERAEIRAEITEHFGASKIDKALTKAKRVQDLDPILLQFKKQMDAEVQAELEEVEEYYEKIDREYKSVGRPKSVFNEKELKYLCSIHCTLEEIAGFFQIHKDTLRKRVKEDFGVTWSVFYERNSQGSRVSLRRRQIQAAMEGDTQMLKFLGKNMLGQKDKVDFDGEVKVNSWVDLITNLDPEGGGHEGDKESKDDGES